jgi:hypothetical protein
MSDFKPRCPNCHGADLRETTVATVWCNDCGYAFAPARALLLRRLEPCEPPSGENATLGL